MPIALFLILLVGHQTSAVINKPNLSSSVSSEYKINNSVEAEKRVGNIYKSPADDYGPPSVSNYKELYPVYGPPELTGDHRPSKIFDSPPPEQQPPLPPQFSSSQSFSSHNPLNKVKPQYSLSKPAFKPLPSLLNQNFSPPQSVFSSSKPEFNLPKPQYGPPKSQYGPPNSKYGLPLSSLKPPKPEYGLPPKFHTLPAPQYGLPSSNSGQTSLDHGLPIPLSIEDYGPPTKESFAPFVSKIEESYGPPPSLQTSPKHQYEVPAANNIYNSPPPPPSGNSAPPTPPDIKYDGWQPIPGHMSASDQQRPLSNNYGPPLPLNNYRPSEIFVPPVNTYDLPVSDRVQGSELSSGNIHPVPVLPNANIPSDSYGTPLNNPEDHSLKSSVSQSTTSHESNGLPPPPLPQFEPLHNHQSSIDGSASNNIDQHRVTGIDLSLNPEKPVSDFQSNSGNNNFYNNTTNQINNSYMQFIFKFPSLGENGLLLQQLPAVSSANYDISVPSNTYGPTSSSISSNGLLSLTNNLRGVKFPLLNQFDFGFHKNTGNYKNRNHGIHRGPPPPFNNFIPPRRPPTKFRDSVPAKLISSLNRYLPSNKPYKIYGPPSIQNQQLPSRQNTFTFQASSNSYTPANSFGRSNTFKIHSALAAPNTNYGTPLSFNDFNTPAPSLTYGAPNFGPASPIGTSGNLYNNAQSNLVPTYGVPAFYSFNNDCDKNKEPNFGNNINDLLKVSASNQQISTNVQAESTIPVNINTNDGKLLINTKLNSLSTSNVVPNPNELELRDYTEQQHSFKDSYGNSIDNYRVLDQSSAALNTHENTASRSNLLPDSIRSSPNSLIEGSSNHGLENIPVQSLNPSLIEKNQEEEKSIPETNIDPTQFIKSDEAGRVLALAQGLTIDGDGFQIEGSKGTYTLQIQPADGGYGTDNSDGSIRHDQVLSNGLLQNILAAIEEQPEGEQIHLRGVSESQILDQNNEEDLTNAASSSIIKIKSDNSESSLIDKQLKKFKNEARIDENLNSSESDRVALFFDKNYNNTKKQA
jgi:hypothetical protein